MLECRTMPGDAAISVEDTMRFVNRMRNKTQIARGRAKQKMGRATGNRKLQMQGVADRVGGNVRQAGEQLKDAGRDLGRSFRR